MKPFNMGTSSFYSDCNSDYHEIFWQFVSMYTRAILSNTSKFIMNQKKRKFKTIFIHEVL